jgi:glycosyltransferase involved in cell wall biosynthesis
MTRKLIRKLILLVTAFINLLTVPLILFLMLIFRLLVMRYKSRPLTFAVFTGLDQVIGKTEVRMERLKVAGIDSVCFASKVKKQQKNVLHTHKIIIINLIRFSSVIYKYRLVYMEIYFDGNTINQFIFLWISKAMEIYSISVMRGELYYYNSTMNSLKKFFIRKIMRASDAIYYRELYMKDIILNEIKIPKEKVFFDPNKVKVSEWEYREKEDKQVLFLNGFKSWRRLDIMIDAIKIINSERPEIHFKLVGARSDAEYEHYRKIVEDNGLLHTEIFFWTDQPQPYYEEASLFVLPADLVYLNFSLLESMERGVPAIIAEVDDAEKIIKHGKDGFISKQDAVSFAYWILEFFRNSDQLEIMSRAARQKVIDHFDDNKRMDRIITELKYQHVHLIKA